MMDLTIFCVLFASNLLFLICGYWMGRNSAGMRMNAQPPVTPKQKATGKQLALGDEDPFGDALRGEEQRIETVEGRR
jgi:hypothetical protein